MRARLRTITPQAAARGAVTVAVVLVSAWLALQTWPALLPFAFGGLIAYAVYPVVDRLDAFMPRIVAAALAVGLTLAVIIGVIAVVVPPLVQQAIALLTNLPHSGDLDRVRGNIDTYLATLPDTTRALIQGVLDRIASQANNGLSGFLDAVAAFIVSNMTHVLGTLGALLGLLLLPIWMLSVIRDGKGVTRVIERQFAPGIRPDAMAIIYIVHRAVSTFIRVQVLAAFLVGSGVWAGLELVQRFTPITYGAVIALAALAGLVQVLPQIGWLLGLLPGVLILVARSSEPAAGAAYLLVYVAATQLVSLSVGQRLSRSLSVRSAIAIPGIIVISEIGVVWLLLSAPILAIARDLVIYLRGRFADPPAPAGVLPGQRVPAPAGAARRPSPAMRALYAAAPTRLRPRPPVATGGEPR